MTVKVTKPAINVRSELADLRKPTGIAGEAMLRAETTQEQFQLIGAGRRNMVINGGFTVWQRSTAGAAGSGFTMDAADRWYSVRGAMSREYENSVPYCHMVHGNFADSCYINHRVEDFAHTLGKQVTISYKIKSDDGLGADGGIFIRYYNSSNAYTTALTSSTYVYGSDWTTVTYTFTMPTTAPKVGYGLEFFLYGDLNSVNNNGKSFDVKEVQLEVGKVATPFEHRSYGEELALCQRYYHKWTSDAAYNFVAMGYAYQATGANHIYHFPVTMRVKPTQFASSGTWRVCSDGCINNVSISAGSYNTNSVTITVTTSGLTAGLAYMLGDANNANSEISWDAEL